MEDSFVFPLKALDVDATGAIVFCWAESWILRRWREESGNAGGVKKGENVFFVVSLARACSVGRVPAQKMASPQMAFALRTDPNKAAKEEAFRADLNVRLVCPDCQEENPNLIEEFGSGDLVCGGCGQSPSPRRADSPLNPFHSRLQASCWGTRLSILAQSVSHTSPRPSALAEPV